jgi:hypothetical protein
MHQFILLFKYKTWLGIVGREKNIEAKVYSAFNGGQ